MVTVDYTNIKPFIPFVIKERLNRNFCGMRLIERGDGKKAAKVPFMPNGTAAKSNDSITWSSMNDCISAWQNGKFATVANGVTSSGYLAMAMETKHKLICLDFDNIQSEEAVAKAVNLFQSYTTVSASGKGLHVWGEVDFAFDYTKFSFESKFDFEMFMGLNSIGAGGRFVTETFKIASNYNYYHLRNITMELFVWIERLNKVKDKLATLKAKPIAIKHYDTSSLSDKAFANSLDSHAAKIRGAGGGQSHATIRASVKVWIDDYKQGKITAAQLDIVRNVLAEAANSRQGQIEEFNACWQATLK
jgi:hypothetical protein